MKKDRNLHTALQEEIQRCKQLLKDYESIGTPGVFAHAMIKEEIRKAEIALIDKDVIAMIRSFQELQECN